MKNVDGERLLNVKEVAQRLGCGPTTVRLLVRERTLPAIRVRGAVKVRPGDVEKYMDQHPY